MHRSCVSVLIAFAPFDACIRVTLSNDLVEWLLILNALLVVHRLAVSVLLLRVTVALNCWVAVMRCVSVAAEYGMLFRALLCMET